MALTRAKNALIVLGKESTLNRDQLWKDYIDWMKLKNAFESINNEAACKKIVRSLLINSRPSKDLSKINNYLEFYDD